MNIAFQFQFHGAHSLSYPTLVLAKRDSLRYCRDRSGSNGSSRVDEEDLLKLEWRHIAPASRALITVGLLEKSEILCLKHHKENLIVTYKNHRKFSAISVLCLVEHYVEGEMSFKIFLNTCQYICKNVNLMGKATKTFLRKQSAFEEKYSGMISWRTKMFGDADIYVSYWTF